jgi:hypothetical protein
VQQVPVVFLCKKKQTTDIYNTVLNAICLLLAFTAWVIAFRGASQQEQGQGIGNTTKTNILPCCIFRLRPTHPPTGVSGFVLGRALVGAHGGQKFARSRLGHLFSWLLEPSSFELRVPCPSSLPLSQAVHVHMLDLIRCPQTASAHAHQWH